MKHSPVWVLGLASLALSSTPVYANPSVYAKNPLTFDPAETSAISSASNIPVASAEEREKDFAPFSVERLNKPPVAVSSREVEASSSPALPDLPLFDLPVFQAPPPSSNSPAPSGSSGSSSSSDRPQPIPEPIAQPPEPSPFELPEDLTDSDLFEMPAAHPPIQQPENRTQPANRTEPPPTPSTAQTDRSAPIPTIPPSRSTRSVRPNVAPLNSSQLSTAQPDPAPTKSVELDFNLPPVKAESPESPAPPLSSAPVDDAPTVKEEAAAEPEPIAPPKPEIASLKEGSLEALFAGESNSLVAIAVGSAEGTRTPHGEKNPAYYGHTDPGNGVWNLGSFSYQHGANSPEEADAKQLARLRSQAETIQQKAAAQGLELTIEEKLNGIDLANQAPKAVLDKAGYVEWLAEAHARGMTGSDAILWARVQSFIDPYTQTWDAPGLGNSEDRITRDQERRMLAIAKALNAYPHNIAGNPAVNPVSARNQNRDRSFLQSERIAKLFTQPFTQLFSSSSQNESPPSSKEAIGTRQILEIDLSDRLSAWSYP